MTPTSERALEMGCVCNTRLMAQPTAITAKVRKSQTSMSVPALLRRESHQQARHQEIHDGHREQEGPGEPHQLVVSKTRQRAADPDEEENEQPGLGEEPEERDQNRLQKGDQEEHAQAEEHESKNGKGKAVPHARLQGLRAVIKEDRGGGEVNQRRNIIAAVGGGPERLPAAQ